MPTLTELIRELREMEKKATEGPWSSGGKRNTVTAPTGEWDGSFTVITDGIYFPSDASLIVLLRNNIVRLLDAAAAYQAFVKELQDKHYVNDWGALYAALQRLSERLK